MGNTRVDFGSKFCRFFFHLTKSEIFQDTRSLKSQIQHGL